jgi:NAD(P)-dependent dehydrogenase (short-subunit alcohol dehydrogenase family)
VLYQIDTHRYEPWTRTRDRLTRYQPYFASELNASAIFPRRLSQPEEVVHGIIYLLENSMMNDFELRVDGGWRGVTNWAGAKDRE